MIKKFQKQKSILQNIFMLQQQTKEFSLEAFLQIQPSQDPFQAFLDKEKASLQPMKMSIITYIVQDQQLDQLQSEIPTLEVVGVDVEYNKSKGYYGQICLIQLSLNQRTFVLNVQSLNAALLQSCLNRIFQNEKLIKVFYGGYQDILWLKQCLHIDVRYPVFDIKIAAEFLNKKFDNSLINLWSSYSGFQFEKSKKKELQQSDWSQQLSQEQIEYAALDAFYLPQLRVLLIKKLVENKGVESLAKLDQQQQKSFEEIDFAIDLHAVQPSKVVKWCQKVVESPSDEVMKKKYLRMDNYFKCIAFILLQLLEKRRTVGLSLNLHPSSELEADESVLQGVVRYFCEQEQNGYIVQAQMQVGEADGELARAFSGIQEKYPEQDMKWAEMRDRIIEDLYGLITRSQESADFAVSEVANIQYQQEKNKNSNMEKKQKKKERFLLFQEKYSCHKPVYSNCKILSPDGVTLCNCDEAKVKWYLAKNLVMATLVSEKPLTIRLSFQPSGVGHSELQEELEQNELQFYSTDRNNQCVVCGQTQHYLKYHIVPMLYRRFFPNAFKSHRSHDVILLCVRCHEKASASSDKLKVRVAEQYKVPYVQHSEQKQQLIQLESLSKVARQYWQQRHNWSKEVRRKMKEKIRQQHSSIAHDEKLKEKLPFPEFERNKKGEVKLSEAFLEFCMQLPRQKGKIKEHSNQDFKNVHGRSIVEQLKSEEDLKAFIKIWRKHFLEEMQPLFLPEAWSLEHKFTRNFGEKSVYSDKSFNS